MFDLRFAGVALAIVLLAAAPAAAQSVQGETDERKCETSSPSTEDRIAACTRLIASRRYKGAELAAWHQRRGWHHYQLGQYDRALADHNEAIRLDPSDSFKYWHRGLAYEGKKDYRRAIADFSQAIRLDPKDGESNLYWRAWAYFKAGDHQRALADFTEAIRIAKALYDAPAQAGRHSHRGHYYYRADDLDRALADYEQALRLEPQRNWMALYGRGLVKLKRGDTQGGNADIASATAIQSNVVQWFKNSYGIESPTQAVARPPVQAAPPPAAAPDKNMTDSIGVEGEAPPAADCARAETHWKVADDIKSAKAYEDHIARFPSCEFADLARMRIEALRK